ncbi:MAG: glycosyltransferase family 2 protein [Nitrospirae bacterium]|nr:glycosyltransferase family 2 protein [Nitrospirota bacterium]
MNSRLLISVIIPNYNKASTIGQCLEAVFSSAYRNFEVIVVDDCSEDNSLEIIGQFPCRLVSLKTHSGASKARNIGAKNSSGSYLFFIDADCVLLKDTLSIVGSTLSATEADVVIGGTYTRLPYDKGFFNAFQSVFVNYSETKNIDGPDYIAAHAMIIHKQAFIKSGGFSEDFLPIMEDVEFSHRLRRSGLRLIMNPAIQVGHIFNFSLYRSIKNAARKSRYWAIYSLNNKDILVDSGTASREFKINILSYGAILAFFILWILFHKFLFLFSATAIFALNAFISRKLLRAFHETKGTEFAFRAFLYYSVIYPVPVGMGACAGLIDYLFKKETYKKAFCRE